MMRKCHLNTCPVGIATQDPLLRKKFAGKPEHVVNYFFFVAEEARELMAKLGIRKFDDLIGRADLLDMRRGIEHWKAKGLDFTRIFHQPPMPPEVARYRCEEQDHRLAGALDHELIAAAAAALDRKQPVRLAYRIRNANRSVGAMLSGIIATRYGHDGFGRRHDSRGVRGDGRPELRRVPRARRDIRAARRHQRLRRQGACPAGASSSIRIRPARRSPRRTSSSAIR